MYKALIFFILLLPLNCLAQFAITGKVLNRADKKPVVDASVFLSNETIGARTVADGTFTLHDVKPGKYDLVVSDIAFETFDQTVIVGNNNVVLPDMLVSPQTKDLNEVTIRYKANPHRPTWYNWFKDEFLGMSESAKECTILNPDVLDLSYNDTTKTLIASSYDFLEIENDALGYRIKYLLNSFSFQNIQDKDVNEKKTDYKGFVLFEDLKGTAGQERRWQRNRLGAYENSPMHFLRAALSNRIDEEGFRVQRLVRVGRPNSQKVSQKLLPVPLHKQDIIRPSDQANQYVLNCDSCDLYVGYSKTRHFSINRHLDYLYTPTNTANTLIKFNTPDVLIYNSGVISNPYNLTYQGVWARYKVAELLPQDYEAPDAANVPDATENIVKLQTFSTTHITEKAYLQFDKPYYAAGDTIYFKACVTMGERHKLSDISGILHVDLINTANKIDQSIKLQLANGVAWGDFALPDSLPKGNYRVRAWTQWMRNDESSFFEQTIPVGSLQKSKIPESGIAHTANANAKPDFQFFPEGGSLVTGIKSKIAFKAVGTNGLGMDVKGIVLDNDNREVSAFTLTHLGMGSFYLNAEPGKTYKAKLSYANGSTDVVELSKAEDKGILLSINNDSVPKATVRIEANKAFYQENKDKEFSLLIYSGGVATTVPCTLDSTVITMDIIKRKLFTGVATVTLFSPTSEPLCERLLFVQNYDQLSLNLSADKADYKQREKVSVKLNARTRADSTATGHFSVSVIDESKVPVDETSETTILTDLLLTSDIKGYVEQPNYYFTNMNDKTASDLDLVMLTHGYRRFEWKQLLSNPYPPVAYQPENGLEISGVAKSILGKPLDHGTVSLISTIGGPVLSQVTDDKGSFHFTNLMFTDTTHFVLNATNAQGKNSTKLTYNEDLAEPVVQSKTILAQNDTGKKMQTYLQNSEKQQEELNKQGLGKGRMLKEVKIRGIKEDNHYASSSLAGPGHADQVMHSDEIEKISGQLATSLNGRLVGVRFLNPQNGNGGIPYLSAYSPGPMLVVIDGIVMSPGTPVNNIVNPNDAETVEVLRSTASASIYGMGGGNGVLIITTKQGKGRDPKDIASIGVLPITAKGFHKAREFYAPKYEHPDSNLNHKDLRSTIYWQPELVTDKDGNATFNYYNADGTGNYRVVIEGIDEKGNIGRTVYRYRVD